MILHKSFTFTFLKIDGCVFRVCPMLLVIYSLLKAGQLQTVTLLSLLPTAGFVYYNNADEEDSSGNSNLDCQPIVDERCPLGQVRLASSRKCVEPLTYDCIPACGSSDGSLDPNDGR